MKVWTEQITKREGENMGKIDSNYDWNQHGIYPNNPEEVIKHKNRILEIEKLFQEGKEVWVYYDPIIRAKVLDVGMYDGWPFWYPVPSILLEHWLGPEWHTWYDIRSYEIMK
jgi:hypothetical protein